MPDTTMADLSLAHHSAAITYLLNEYANDEMGDEIVGSV
jgi:hypothetical protein